MKRHHFGSFDVLELVAGLAIEPTLPRPDGVVIVTEADARALAVLILHRYPFTVVDIAGQPRRARLPSKQRWLQNKRRG